MLALISSVPLATVCTFELICSAVADAPGFHLLVFGARRYAGFGKHPGKLGNSQAVQDQRHLAVAHDGGAGKSGNPLELFH